MKLAELQKKVADVLGVSVSQKELSFEIFVATISEILTEDITLKVPRVGFFQNRQTGSHERSDQIIFSPLSEDYSRDMRNLYLTIDTIPRQKNTFEFSSNIFSIGVGKPLLPLTMEEIPNTETSYAILKKSIEERVKELIAESDQIPNFNIWDDYYKSPEDYEEKESEEVQARLDELTSDLDFTEITIPQSLQSNIFEIPVFEAATGLNKEEEILTGEESPQSYNEPAIEISENVVVENIFPSETISEDKSIEVSEQLFGLPEEEKAEPIESSNEENGQIFFEDSVFENDSMGSLTLADLLSDIEIKKIKTTHEEVKIDARDKIIPVENEETPVAEEPQIVPSDFWGLTPEEIKGFQEEAKKTKIDDWLEKQSKEPVIASEKNLSLQSKIENEKQTDKNWIEEQSKEIKDETEEKWNGSQNDEEEQELIHEPPAQDDNLSEWNWGDELRDEFGIERNKYDNLKFDFENKGNENEELELIDEPIDTDKKFTRDLFKQLEHTLEREKSFDENSVRKTKLVFDEPVKDDSKKVFLEFNGPPAKYEFVEDNKNDRDRKMAISLVQETATSRFDDFISSDSKPEEKEKYFGKTFIIIFAAFIVISSVIIFLFMKSNSSGPQNTKQEISEIKEPANNAANLQKNDIQKPSASQKNIQTQQKNVIPSTTSDEISDFPISAIPPVPIKKEDQTPNDYKKQTPASDLKLQATSPIKSADNNSKVNADSETRIGKSIYSDGKSYSYQTSSWKNRQKAEQELKRLHSLGINANIVEVYLPLKGGTWYRVRVGPFNSVQSAESDMKKNNLN